MLNKPTRKTFQEQNFKVSYKTKNNSFKIIQNLSGKKIQNPINKFEKSGVYKIKCDDCPKFYIGQTGRNFKCRFKEHIQAIRSNNLTSQKSAFAEHILDSQHNYTGLEHNMEILNIAPKGEKLNALEDYQIYLHKIKNQENLLNSMQTENKNPIFEKIIQLKQNQPYDQN